MIVIQQDIVELDGLDSIINKHGDANIKVDLAAIESDIKSLEEKIQNPLSRIDKKNARNVLNYIEKLKGRAVDSNIELVWSVDKHALKSYPVQFNSIPAYNIEMTDYVDVSGESLIRFDYSDVFNVIALDMAYRDLGETNESIEEMLDEVGVTGIYPASILLSNFEPNIFEVCKTLIVDDSPYRASDLKITQEYFGIESFKSKYYSDCLEYSAKHALAIIASNLLGKLVNSKVKFSLCSVSTSGIYVIIHDNNTDIADKIKESVVVRAFGRRFEVHPRITVF